MLDLSLVRPSLRSAQTQTDAIVSFEITPSDKPARLHFALCCYEPLRVSV